MSYTIEVGRVSSYAEGLRAIRFLARLSKLPIKFFGLQSDTLWREPCVTYDIEVGSKALRAAGSSFPSDGAAMQGALDAWKALNRSNRRRRRMARDFAHRVRGRGLA